MSVVRLKVVYMCGMVTCTCRSIWVDYSPKDCAYWARQAGDYFHGLSSNPSDKMIVFLQSQLLAAVNARYSWFIL